MREEGGLYPRAPHRLQGPSRSLGGDPSPCILNGVLSSSRWAAVVMQAPGQGDCAPSSPGAEQDPWGACRLGPGRLTPRSCAVPAPSYPVAATRCKSVIGHVQTHMVEIAFFRGLFLSTY